MNTYQMNHEAKRKVQSEGFKEEKEMTDHEFMELFRSLKLHCFTDCPE
jgi:hypothetical protein